MKKNSIKRFIALTSTVFALYSFSSCNFSSKSTDNTNSNETINTEISNSEKHISNQIISFKEREPYNLEESINSLNIKNYNDEIAKTIKVAYFKDKDGNYKVSIVKGIVNYIDDGETIEEYVSICDIFNEKWILDIGKHTNTSEYDLNKIYYINSELEGYTLVDIKSIDELKNVATNIGMNPSYVLSIPFNHGDTINTYDIACYYIKLINESDRLMLENENVLVLQK